jgi:hypothetical protein
MIPVLLALYALAGAQVKPAPVTMELPVQDKNFYLLSMIERTPAVRAAVKKDGALARIAAARTCNLDLPCYEWTDSQTQEAAGALR